MSAHLHIHTPFFLHSRKPAVNVVLPKKVRLFPLSFLYLEVSSTANTRRALALSAAALRAPYLPAAGVTLGGRGSGSTQDSCFSSWCSSPGSALGISHGLALAGKPGRRRRLWASPPPCPEPEPNSNRAPNASLPSLTSGPAVQMVAAGEFLHARHPKS